MYGNSREIIFTLCINRYRYFFQRIPVPWSMIFDDISKVQKEKVECTIDIKLDQLLIYSIFTVD